MACLVLGAVGPAAPALAEGGGACCFKGVSCQNVADAAECAVLGGVFLPGADCANDPCDPGGCCSETSCVVADAYSCITSGRDFAGAGTVCADDPCGFGAGACCFKDGSCRNLSEKDCAGAGGTFLGLGMTCAQGGCGLGACCLPGGCTDLAEFECEAQGGLFFLGEPCANEPCPPNDCPADSLLSQQRDEPDDFTAGTSEASAGFERFDDFTGVAGPIEGLIFYGLDLDFIPPNQFIECVENDNTFVINFHEDAGGQPGNLVCSYKLTATRTPTGILYLGAELNEYSVTLPFPCTLVNGWVSIVGLGDPQCWFFWMSAGAGESWCDGCASSSQPFNLAMCLLGTPGGVFGACCNDGTGSCADNVEISDCTAPGLRFEPDTLCADLDPPCGIIEGACCVAGGACTIEQEADCVASGGLWLGADTLCDQCPCLTPCPKGGTPEEEVDCFEGYVDVTNGGCESISPAFAPISLGETVCGTSGVYDDGGSIDFDYYEITVNEPLTLVWSANAEFPPRIWIIDAEGGCPGTVLSTTEAVECEDVSIGFPVDPGTYWLVIAPNAFTDTAACGAGYAATASAPCPHDIDGDGSVGTSDLLDLLAGWGPNPGHPADFDGSGVVGTADLLELLASWGPCPS